MVLEQHFFDDPTKIYVEQNEPCVVYGNIQMMHVFNIRIKGNVEQKRSKQLHDKPKSNKKSTYEYIYFVNQIQ